MHLLFKTAIEKIGQIDNIRHALRCHSFKGTYGAIFEYWHTSIYEYMHHRAHLRSVI